MVNGLNITSKSTKGPRSYIHLNNLRERLVFLAKLFESCFWVCVHISGEEHLFAFFNGMRNGETTKSNG